MNEEEPYQKEYEEHIAKMDKSYEDSLQMQYAIAKIEERIKELEKMQKPYSNKNDIESIELYDRYEEVIKALEWALNLLKGE